MKQVDIGKGRWTTKHMQQSVHEWHDFHDGNMDRDYMQCICIQDRVIDQAVPRVQSQVTSCEIRRWKFGTETGFSQSYFDFNLLGIIPSLLYGHLSRPSAVWCSRDHAAHYHVLGFWVQNFCVCPGIWVLQNQEFIHAWGIYVECICIEICNCF
jgi:hypothetical protein